MRVTGFLPAGTRRRTLMWVTLPVMFLTGSVIRVEAQSAQQPQAQTAQASQQPAQAPPARTFGSDAGMIFSQIKPDKTADFEMVMAKLKEALQKSEDPVRKQQAAGWKVFKSLEPSPTGNVLYIFIMDPAVKGADYTVSKILAEVFPAEVQELYKKFSDAYAGGQNLVNLQLIQSFGPTSGGAPPQ